MHQKILKKQLETDHIYEIISKIIPFDDLEQTHINETLSWIKSGAELFRISEPNIPNKHLVCYFPLFDEVNSKILLVDHKKGQLWLPAGGHVEINEDPKETVQRECSEELQVIADFWDEQPIFLTSTLITIGETAGHTDVSLWYVLKGNHRTNYTFSANEFNSIKWFGFNEIPHARTDPHMYRFINKLRSVL